MCSGVQLHESYSNNKDLLNAKFHIRFEDFTINSDKMSAYCNSGVKIVMQIILGGETRRVIKISYFNYMELFYLYHPPFPFQIINKTVEKRLNDSLPMI